MIRYGKLTQSATAAVSRLAEVYDSGRRLCSAEIAGSRGLSRANVAKVLTKLSHAGLVIGSPGPGGGYALARHPAKISLYDVAAVFERVEDKISCPFGPNWCGVGESCPLHDRLQKVDTIVEQYLRETTFGVFRSSSVGSDDNDL